MNVVITNKSASEITDLDIDIIKNLNGEYDASEIVEMFSSFFYERMIIDVTAIKGYENPSTYKILADGLEQEKFILLLPAGSSLCTPNFLARLISFGIYNFTTNGSGIMYLLKKPNTHDDVSNIEKMATGAPVTPQQNTSPNTNVAPIKSVGRKKLRVVGFRNITNSSGATSLIYMIKKDAELVYGTDGVIAIEVNKNDFSFFYDPRMISTNNADFVKVLGQFNEMKLVLVDLNDSTFDNYCDDIFYLIEPSTLKLNSLMRRNRNIFTELSGRRVILNQSLLSDNDVRDFESESNLKIAYNLPPVDDRKRSDVIHDFAIRTGLVPNDGSVFENPSKLFGFFKR